MTDIQDFTYRIPRFAVTLPLTLTVAGNTISGRTLNLSENGILVHLDEPVLAGTEGRVCLRLHSCSVELQVLAAYSHLFEVGLSFRFISEAEQAFVKTLVKLVSRYAGARATPTHTPAAASSY